MNGIGDGILGLFPQMGVVGGIERSGHEAWRAVAGAAGESSHLISYHRTGPADSCGELRQISGTIYETCSQALAISRAASRGWPVRLILVWHIGLVKLLPFVRASGAKTVLFLHGIEAWRNLSPAMKRLLRRVDCFLSNSEFTWESFLSWHPEFRAVPHVVVPLGLGEPMTGGVEMPGVPPTALMMGRIARGEAYKGHDAVIRAWRGVIAAFPGAKLRMIGPSEMTPELTSLARDCGIGNELEIDGEVSESRKERSLAECCCMALPSRGEGFGLAYIESMRLGRPCLVSTLDAGREVVCPPESGEAAGLAIDPADISAVTAALIRLMTPGPEWNRWSATGRRRYTAFYTAAHFRARLLDALAGVA